MAARAMLGPADVTDDQLAGFVADALGVEHVELTSCEVQVVDYDLEALTTAGRYWVRGRARHTGGDEPYAFFVKVVQSWARTPQFQMVPEHLREQAARGLPWRGELAVYRSDLASRLPDGLTLPRVHLVDDIDDLSAFFWLEAVDADPSRWDDRTFERAAYRLGRLAACPAVAPVAAAGVHDVVRGYAHGRVEGQIMPALRTDALWAHPLVADTFSPALKSRLLAAADALPTYLDELDAAPLGTAHGDACPRNLLVPRSRPDDFVLIDYAFWCRAPLGFDLTQLLIGEVQVGERPAAHLADLDELCLTAYARGLAAEGCDVPLDVVRRAHALLMLLFAGLTAVPIELLFGGQAPGNVEVVRGRATALTHVLDLVQATADMPIRGGGADENHPAHELQVP
jgi:hypothetical protein